MPDTVTPSKMTIGKVLQVLDKAVPKEGEFSESLDEREVRGLPETDDAPEAPETPEAPPAPAPSGEAPPAPAQAPTPSAAPMAAEPPAPVDEWEDFEIDDPDLGKRYKVRARKEDADLVKRGYERHSSYSRKMGYLGKYQDLLAPLITEGRFDDVANIISLGNSNAEFRNAMYEAYYRATTGKPLTFADQQAIAAATQTPAAPADDPNDVLAIGPLIDARLAPLVDKVNTVYTNEQQRTQWQQTQAQNDAINRYNEQKTYADFGQYFPGEYTGDPNTDWQKMQAVFNYARNAKLFEREGADKNPYLMPAVMLKAKLELDRAGARQSAAAAAAVPSSAALDASKMAEEAERMAREAAAKVASQVSPGGPAPAARKKQFEKPSVRDDKGRPKPINKFLQEYVDAEERAKAQ